MTAVDEESRLGDDPTGSWRTSTEQQEALLGHQTPNIKDDQPWRNDKQNEDEEEEGWFMIRWWHLVVLLVVCTLAVPGAVKAIHKGSYRHPDASGQSNTGEDRYMIDPEWDYHATPRLREYTWTLTESKYNPDGVYRNMLLINKQFPGPMIEANEGDTIRVVVQNHMSNATAIHWHGMYQNGTNWMDGTVGITQCPIAAGSTFTYEFHVANQSGTYWYHAHQGVQSSDGLHGPLIIHSEDERMLQKIEYATDRVIMVSDHYHDLSSGLARKYLGPDMENAEPVPDGALINGHAVRNCDDLPHRKCDNSTSNVGLASFSFAPHQHHRLRIINVGAFAEFQFQVDEHELAVTETDGTDVLPIWYHRININPAQRYSVILHANNSEAESFRMRARMITTCFAEPNPYMAAEVNAIVTYGFAANTLHAQTDLPESTDWADAQDLECRDLNTTELVPAQVIAAPEKADAFFYLRSNFEIGAYRLSRGFFNSSSWRGDVRSPTLLRTIDGLHAGNTSFSPPSSTNTTTTENGDTSDSVFINSAAFDSNHELTIQSPGISTIDILISNFDDGAHPMHLHGYKYFVLASGHGYPPRKSLYAPMTVDNLSPLYDTLDLSNPLRRDTASVEAFGWVLLRFVADNPGVWAFHCHVAWHSEAGLMMQFLTRTEGLEGMEVPGANRKLCQARGLESGAGPRDEVYYDEA